MNARNNNSIKKHQLAGTIIIAAVAIVILVLTVAASFTGDSKKSYVQETGTFYFTSDMLTESGATYTVYENEVSIALSNSADSLRFSENDVTYSVEKTGTATLSSSGGTLSGGSNDSDVITITDATGIVTVKATSAPFRKLLTATFVFVADNSTYEIEDHGNYCTLILRTGSTAPTLTVNWNPTNLSPDNTNPLMTAWTDGSETLSALVGSNVYRLIFFKNASANYTRAETAVSGASITIG